MTENISYTPSLAAALYTRGISLLLTARLSNYLIIVRAKTVAELDIHLVNTSDPFTVATGGGMLAISTEDKITFLTDAPEAHHRLNPPDVFDAVYVPRVVQMTGPIAPRDAAFGLNGRLYVASVGYNAIAEVNPSGMASFAETWRAPQISESVREDRCHLNGICMMGGYPRIASLVDATSNVRAGWRAHRGKGALVDIKTDRILVPDLAMPHSPRYHRGGVWFCDSARGLVKRYDPSSGQVSALGGPLPGFTRGLDFHKNLAFVGVSRTRSTAAIAAYPHLRSLGEEQLQGVWMLPIAPDDLTGGYLHLPTIGEITDIKILPHRFPAVIVPENFSRAYAYPERGMADHAWMQLSS